MTAKIIYIFKYITLNTSCQHCLAVVRTKSREQNEWKRALLYHIMIYNIPMINDRKFIVISSNIYPEKLQKHKSCWCHERTSKKDDDGWLDVV